MIPPTPCNRLAFAWLVLLVFVSPFLRPVAPLHAAVEPASFAAFSSRAGFTIAANDTTVAFVLTPGLRGPLTLRAVPGHTHPNAAEAAGEIVWEGFAPADNIIRLPRLAPAASATPGADRLHQRFTLRGPSAPELADAPAQWVTTLDAVSAAAHPFYRPVSKKGLACIIDPADLAPLGVAHANENIDIGHLIDLRATNPAPEFTETIDGVTIAFRPQAVAQHDRAITRLTKQGINVVGILLNSFGALPADAGPLLHPDSARGGRHAIIGAFNTTSAEGLLHYRAAVRFLARRYTAPGAPHGWLSGLVIGNEMNSHWVWNNQGEADEDTVLRDYGVAVRAAWLEGRAIHRDFQVYVSLEHHWTLRGSDNNPRRSIAGRTVLDKLTAASRAEGDYPWQVAYHPYPESLFKPDFWTDRQAPLQPDAFKITFNNLEVLDHYLRDPARLHRSQPRRIALTEQGFHFDPKLPDGEALQAAAYSLAYYKIERMPLVEMFLYHRHVDHPREGGLNLGLRASRSKNDDRDPGARRRIFESFAAAGTPDNDRVNAFALRLAGLRSWSEAGPATKLDPIRPRTDDTGVIHDLLAKLGDARVEKALAFSPDGALQAAGWLVPGILHHPPANGESTATWTLALPSLAARETLAFTFGTGFVYDKTTDGVTFSVRIDGKTVFEKHQDSAAPVLRRVDLTRLAGRTIELTLVVSPGPSSAHDGALWTEPLVRRETNRR